MQSTGELPGLSVEVVRPGAGVWPYAATTLVFLVSRLLLRGLGIAFNGEALDWYWQVLDPALLRAALAESLVHLHVQPPLFNLLIGLASKLFHDPVTALAWMWTASGLCMTLTIQATLQRLGWPGRFAAPAAVACALSLPWIAYENWLFYDFPCTALLAFGGYCLLRAAGRADHRWAAAFAATLLALAWTRSLFHLAWVIAAAVLFVASSPGARRRATLWMLVPALLVVGLFAKNAAVFGFFGSSSWLGLSLTKMTVQRLSPEERAAMIRDGRISAYAAVPPFGPLAAYEAITGARFTDDPLPALGARVRSSGNPNFNHRAFVEIAGVRFQDAVAVVRMRPDVYVDAVRSAVRRFFSPTIHYPPFERTLILLEPAYRLYVATFGAAAVAVLVYALALLFAAAALFRRDRSLPPGARAAAGWVLLNLLWVLVVGCLLEVGENHRFRFTVTPLVWMTILGSLPSLRGIHLR